MVSPAPGSSDVFFLTELEVGRLEDQGLVSANQCLALGGGIDSRGSIVEGVQDPIFVSIGFEPEVYLKC
jgi:hypothetical protein